MSILNKNSIQMYQAAEGKAKGMGTVRATAVRLSIKRWWRFEPCSWLRGQWRGRGMHVTRRHHIFQAADRSEPPSPSTHRGGRDEIRKQFSLSLI